MRPTKKQLAVLDVIRNHVNIHKYPPTVREIAASVGLRSISTAHGYLSRLKAHGMIKWEAERPRTLKILKP